MNLVIKEGIFVGPLVPNKTQIKERELYTIDCNGLYNL